MRARTATRSDAGQISTTLVIAAAGLLLTVTMFAGTGGGFDQDAAACQAQPDATREARDSIPARYLTLYRKTGRHYGIAWNLLAAIGKVESDHGRAPGVRSGANYAGAAGPMQIGIGGAATNNWGGAPRHRATAKVGGYGVDGNKDGWADVYDPADAIPAAARFLKVHGAPGDVRAAVFAYNPSTAYVNKVLAQAARYAEHGAQAITAPAAPTCERAAIGPVPANGVAAAVVSYAHDQLGKPYVYGATGPDSFDCSGLTMRAYRAAGVTIPRLSDAQYWWGARVPAGRERPGDLVFFNYRPGHSGPGHVGIVYSPRQGTMIVAPHTGDVVKLQNYKTYPGGTAGFTRPAAHDGAASEKRRRVG